MPTKGSNSRKAEANVTGTKLKEVKVLRQEMVTVVLKPCPFCGTTDVVNNEHCVSCALCGTEGPKNANAYRAVNLWNTRIKE